MWLPRIAARLFLAWVFVRAGLDVLRHPEPRATTAAAFIDQMRALVPFVPDDRVALVRANAAVQVAAAGLLAVGAGKLSRLAALTLAASLVPTTLGGHAFWTHQDPGSRAQQRVHFDKNLAILGGLLFVALQSPDRDRRSRA
jgi:putative oxidoreductase